MVNLYTGKKQKTIKYLGGIFMTQKECLYKMIHQNRKPLKLIAEEIGVSANYLYRAALPDPDESETGSGCRFPLNKLVPVTISTGDFALVDSIEQSLGRVAFPLPKPSDALSDICRLAMAAVKEFGELMAEMEADMADGSISQTEADRIRKEGYEAVQSIMNLLENLKK